MVCYFPGHNSSASKQGNIAKALADRGFDYIGMDYKGYGKSEGTKGLISSLDELYDDCYQFFLLAKEYYKVKHPETELPFFTYGNSLGCKVAIGVARKLHENGKEAPAG